MEEAKKREAVAEEAKRLALEYAENKRAKEEAAKR